MIAFLAAQLVSLGAGVLLMAALAAWRMPLGLFIPTAWIAGTGVLAAEHLLLAQIGLPWNPLSLGSPWLAVAGLAVWRVRLEGWKVGRACPERSEGLERPKLLTRLIEALVGILIIAWTAKMLIITTSTQLVGWDGLVDWVFKGRAMYATGGLPVGFLTDPRLGFTLHPDYPPLVPLTVAQTYAWTGDNDALVKGWWALLAGAALAGVYYGMRGIAGQAARLCGLVLLLGIPEIATYAAGHLTGYADLPMAVLFLYGVLFLYRWLKQPTSADFVLAALFFSLTGFTKNEGLIIAGRAWR